MAGTDHGQEKGWGGPQPVFVLVNPQLGENIGAAARAMWNFGLEHMRLVAPRDGWPNPAAAATASGAGRVLDGARIDATTAEAIGDLNTVYATTARPRGLIKDVLTPEEAMRDARARITSGERVGVLFGPERAGLENADIVRASAIISVPVNPAFASLNLAQCVLLTAYEWRRSGAAPLPSEPRARPASRIEIEKLTESLMARLEVADFFQPEDKRRSLTDNLENLLARLPLTEPEVRMLHGVFRALADRHPVRRP